MESFCKAHLLRRSRALDAMRVAKEVFAEIDGARRGHST